MNLSKNISIPNKKAKFEYAFLEEYSAGMVLTGTEIKSIRQAKVRMSDAYCIFNSGQLFVNNLNEYLRSKMKMVCFASIYDRMIVKYMIEHI